MKIDEQVTSLELSKKLRELGVKQESAFYWENSTFTDGLELRLKKHTNPKGSFEFCSAFTVAELGKILPIGMSVNQVKKNDYVPLFPKGELPMTLKQLKELITELEKVKTEADARAKMLIYLIENALVDREAQQQTLPEGHIR